MGERAAITKWVGGNGLMFILSIGNVGSSSGDLRCISFGDGIH